MTTVVGPYSRYIIGKLRTLYYVRDRLRECTVAGPFIDPRDARTRMEELHELDRSRLARAISENENGIADRMLNDVFGGCPHPPDAQPTTDKGSTAA